MARRMWTRVGYVAAAAALVGAAGCGGGSGGTAPTGAETTALKVADQVSVVDAKTETGGAAKLLAKLAGVWTGAPAGSDYEKDVPSVYVHEKAADSFATVNEILCLMSQTKYDEMVNKGYYKALVNQKVCRGNDDVSNSTQQGGSASNAPDYMEWTVRSSRADNNSPQTLEAWIHQRADGMDPEMLIQAKAVITEGSSVSNPYGIFTMNFVGYPSSDGVPNLSATPFFKGVLAAQRDANGKVLLKFTETGEDETRSVAMEKTGTAGGGRASFSNEWEGSGEIIFAYNDSLFHRQDASGTNEICLDRDDFETSAWRYGMYDATTGGRVSVNSGFPINTAANGSGKHGWVGYWGLWVPDGVSITNGSTVYKQNYGPEAGAATPYTVVKAGGKLKKHTRKTATLGAIKNIPLEMNDFQTNSQYRVIWDGTKLVKTAWAANTMEGPPVWSEINSMSPSANFDVTNLQWGELNFWSQALGGQVRIPLAGCVRLDSGATSCNAPTADTAIVYYVEDIVYPGDTVPDTLACFDNCPELSAGNVYGGAYGLMTAMEYTFDPETDLVLKKDGVPLIQTAAGQQWGYNSGPLFDAALDDDPATSPLKCDWTGPEGQYMICGWKAWSVLEEFYTWETGLQNWNQLTLLKDPQTNDVLKFEQPLRVEYTYTTNSTNPAAVNTKYNGTKFFLDYNGFGELHGIPGKCVDFETGETVASCNETTRWVPEFTIPEGATASYTKNGTTYNTRIKPLQMEQRMVKLENSECGTLPFGSYTLPTIAEWVDPALGTEPAVTAAPAVIAGEVKVQ